MPMPMLQVWMFLWEFLPATIGIDFTYTTTTVTFPAGSSTTQTVFLGIIDAIVETSENIVLNLQNPTNGATIGSMPQPQLILQTMNLTVSLKIVWNQLLCTLTQHQMGALH